MFSLAYLISSDELIKMIEEGPSSHSSTLIALSIFTGVFYFVFVWFREQVCIIACPYGRLQGVLLDNKSINVAYDFVRGEKEVGRAKFNKQEDRAVNWERGIVLIVNNVSMYVPQELTFETGHNWNALIVPPASMNVTLIMESVGYAQRA